MCQHDLAARDDRDPSQNSATAGQQHRGGREGAGGGQTGARAGDGTSGGLDGIQLMCWTDCTLYDLNLHPIQPLLEEHGWQSSTITGFLVGVM